MTAVIAVVVIIFLACGGSYVVYENYKQRQQAEAMAQALRGLQDGFGRAFSSQPVATPKPRRWVPPSSVDECMKTSAGVINETFQRCRAGYWIQQ